MNAVNSQPHKLAVFTPKGGTAKTTTAHSVACQLARDGARVLAIDLDAQERANLSYWFSDTNGPGPTLMDVVRGESTLAAAVRPSGVPSVDLVPSDGRLAGAEGMLRAGLAPDRWLRKQLRTLPPDRWDWIVLDCAPGLGILTIAALVAADWALAPVPPSALDAGGIVQVVGYVEEIRTELNPGLRMLGVVPVQVDRRRAVTREILDELGQGLGNLLCETRIPVDVRLVEAPSHHQSIYDYAPRCRAAAAYEALTAEIKDRVASAIG